MIQVSRGKRHMCYTQSIQHFDLRRSSKQNLPEAWIFFTVKLCLMMTYFCRLLYFERFIFILTHFLNLARVQVSWFTNLKFVENGKYLKKLIMTYIIKLNTAKQTKQGCFFLTQRTNNKVKMEKKHLCLSQLGNLTKKGKGSSSSARSVVWF